MLNNSLILVLCLIGLTAFARAEGQSALQDADEKEMVTQKIYYQEAVDALNKGLWGKAIATLKNAISHGPYNEGYRYLLGNVMASKASPDEMIAYYRMAIAFDPKPQTSYYYLAVGLERQGKHGQAIKTLKKALEIDPAHEMSQNFWGVILEKQNRLNEALAHYQEAVEIHPEFKVAHENCARVLNRLSLPVEAEKHRQLAQQSNPNTPRRFLYWGQYLVKQGRYNAAVPELRKALEANPQDSEAQQLLNQALKHSGTQ